MKFLRRLSLGATTPSSSSSSSSLPTTHPSSPLRGPYPNDEPVRNSLVKTTSICSTDTTVCTEPSEHSSFSDSYNYTCVDTSCLCNNYTSTPGEPVVSRRRVQFALKADLYSAPWIYTDHDEGVQDNEQDFQNEKRCDSEPQQPENNEMLVISKNSIWYNSNDVAQFKGRVKVYVHRLQMRERHQPAASLSSAATNNAIIAWTTRLHDAFCALENPATNTKASRVRDILSTARPTDALLVGLEKWVHMESATARSQQRKVLFQTVKRAQASGVTCPTELSRLSSQASRAASLFAIYVALTVLPDRH